MLRAIVLILVLVIVGALYSRDLSSRKHCHPDEPKWIYAGKMYTDLFFYYRAFGHPLWRHHFGTFGSFNPPVGKYILGLSLNSFGGVEPIEIPMEGFLSSNPAQSDKAVTTVIERTRDRLGYFDHYNYEYDVPWNIEHGLVPSPEILRSARTGVLICALVAGASLFWLADGFFGWGVGVLAMVAFYASPMVYSFSRRAMPDVPCLMFVLLGFAAFLVALEDKRDAPLKVAFFSLVSGIGFGLGIGAKLTALPAWAGAWGMAFALWAYRLSCAVRGGPSSADATTRLMDRTVLLVFITALPPFLFIASNPFLYDKPLSPFHKSPSRVAHLLSLTGVVQGFHAPDRLEGPVEKIGSAIRFLTLRAAPSSRFLPFGAGLLFAVLGATRLPRCLAKGELPCKNWERWVSFFGVSAVVWVVTIYWRPFAWDRYLIPLLPFYCILVAFGIEKIGTGLHSLWTRNQAHSFTKNHG
jgi:hypothetical protein